MHTRAKPFYFPFSHITRQAQYEHPCAPQYLGAQHILNRSVAAPVSSVTSPPPPSHTHFHQPNVLVPPNPYLHEEIPIWLRVYCKASPTLDHHLKWDLFGLQELECFEAMLNRLFRDELEELVMK